MADYNALNADLLAVLAKHGVTSLPGEAVAAPNREATVRVPSLGTVASYIKEIITGDQAFDERVLARVTSVLSGGK